MSLRHLVIQQIFILSSFHFFPNVKGPERTGVPGWRSHASWSGRDEFIFRLNLHVKVCQGIARAIIRHIQGYFSAHRFQGLKATLPMAQYLSSHSRHLNFSFLKVLEATDTYGTYIYSAQDMLCVFTHSCSRVSWGSNRDVFTFLYANVSLKY